MLCMLSCMLQILLVFDRHAVIYSRDRGPILGRNRVALYTPATRIQVLWFSKQSSDTFWHLLAGKCTNTAPLRHFCAAIVSFLCRYLSPFCANIVSPTLLGILTPLQHSRAAIILAICSYTLSWLETCQGLQRYMIQSAESQGTCIQKIISIHSSINKLLGSIQAVCWGLMEATLVNFSKSPVHCPSAPLQGYHRLSSREEVECRGCHTLSLFFASWKPNQMCLGCARAKTKAGWWAR